MEVENKSSDALGSKYQSDLRLAHKNALRDGRIGSSDSKGLSSGSSKGLPALDDGAWAATIEQVAASDKKAARWADKNASRGGRMEAVAPRA